MRVLLAFDKFKDSLTAREACTFAATALHDRRRDWEVVSCPLSDGGEGFCEILTAAARGQVIGSSVTGPRDKAAQASIGMVPYANIPTPARRFLPPPPEHPPTRPRSQSSTWPRRPGSRCWNRPLATRGKRRRSAPAN